MNKYRLIMIKTPSKTDKKFIKLYQKINKHKKTFDMLSTKIKVISNSTNIEIELYGIDGKMKFKADKFNNENTISKICSTIIEKIKEMPMSKNISKLTLYADYHPEDSVKGLGFKNKETAMNTIEKIKNMDKTYQFLVINTMYNRAKYHPYRTKDMEEAMKIFKKWLDKRK